MMGLNGKFIAVCHCRYHFALLMHMLHKGKVWLLQSNLHISGTGVEQSSLVSQELS